MNLAKIMTPKVFTVFLHETDTVRQGLEVMRRHGYTAIPVLDQEDKYLGSISEGDFLWHILDKGTTDMKAQERYRISELLRRDFCEPLDIEADRERVLEALLKQNFVPIVDSRNVLCGIVTRRSAMKYLFEEQQ